MCLYTNFKEPKIAEEDIICYKIYTILYKNKMYSPYRSVLSPNVGIITTTLLGTPIKETNTLYRIEEGFHSFKSLNEAMIIMCNYKLYSYLNKDHVVFKCVIPKDSLYYLGRFDKYESYCSNSIKLVEVCV